MARVSPRARASSGPMRPPRLPPALHAEVAATLRLAPHLGHALQNTDTANKFKTVTQT